jgi:hypothetical protein
MKALKIQNRALAQSKAENKKYTGFLFIDNYIPDVMTQIVQEQSILLIIKTNS